MFATERFVFLHIPKTGGTFIDRILRRHFDAVQVGSRHSSYRDVPEHLSHLPGFYAIRDPWDWYVSWYHHQIEGGGRKMRSAGKRALWEQLLLAGRADFGEAVRRACSSDFEHPLRATMRARDVDLYSGYVLTIAGPVLDRADFTVLRFERLREDLLRFLGQHGELSAELRSEILQGPQRRISTHRPYREYYDRELHQLVAEKTSWLRGRFGYEVEELPTALVGS